MTTDQYACRLPVKIIRGGSSKGIFVRSEDLPQAGPERDRLVLRLFGAPDVRQIDGLGGGDKLTSKLAVMGTPTRSDCDISYLFAQVGTKFPDVDWDSNCGNISSGAALFAAIDGVGTVEGGRQQIAIEQSNTGRRLLATVPFNGNRPAVTGTFAIGGVPGTGPRIDLDFADFEGSCLNRGLFPSGIRQQELALPDDATFPVTIVDMANLNVLIQANVLGLDLSSSLEVMQNNTTLLDRLDAIRSAVLIELGLATRESAPAIIRRSVNPLIHILAEPKSYRSLNGNHIDAGDCDLISRSYARRAFSKAFPGTGAIGVAVASRVTGTLATRYGSNAIDRRQIRIGHPSGCLGVETIVSEVEKTVSIQRALIGRTARVLMEGTAYLD